VLGGHDATGATVRAAEIAEVRIDFLPGDVVLTGSLPTGANVGAATTLLDHTVLVASEDTLSLYFSPRE
jgi:hypothetical protein